MVAVFFGVVFPVITYDSFLGSLIDFIHNWKKYFEHIKHQGADPFLSQEIDFYVLTQHINTLMLHISNTLHLEYYKIDFPQIRGQFAEAYKYYNVCPEIEVLEMEITETHRQIQQNIPSIILGIKHLILNLEKDYWLAYNPNLYHEVTNMEWEYNKW